MGDDEFNSPDFLDKLRAGDNAAYRQLVRRFHGSFVGVANGIIGSRAQAEEVVQDAWLAVFSGIGRFEGRSNLSSWMFTIVINRARTRATREGRLVALPELDGAPREERSVPLSQFQSNGHWAEAPKLWDELDPERLVQGRQLWAHAQDAIDALPPQQKAVIILRDIEGRSAEDACAILDVSSENQRVLLHRARGRVRVAIDRLMLPGTPEDARSRIPEKRGHDRGVRGVTRVQLRELGVWLIGLRRSSGVSLKLSA